jgi:hypothetical protein
MASLQGFNASNVEPAPEFDPIPAGKYLAAITESELKPTSSGAGEYLQLTFQVLDGPQKGRCVWARLNLVNANATTVQIARQQLASVCRAVGILEPGDSRALHNIPLVIGVKLKPRKDTGEIVNEIRTFARRDALGPAPQASTQSAPPPVASAYGGSTPPWKR